eukprot:scaffold13094_cov70-Phaeocystis_antarctica.AAC.8
MVDRQAVPLEPLPRHSSAALCATQSPQCKPDCVGRHWAAVQLRKMSPARMWKTQAARGGRAAPHDMFKVIWRSITVLSASRS